MLEVKNINQLGLIYIYTMLQSAKEEDTFFSSLHIKITEIGGILEKKKKPHGIQVKWMEVIWLSDRGRIKLEDHNGEITLRAKKFQEKPNDVSK